MAARGRSLVQLLLRHLLLVVGGLWLLASLGVAWQVRVELAEGYDGKLLESAYTLLDLVDHELAEQEHHPDATMNLRLLAKKALEELDLGENFLIFQMLDQDRRVLRRSLDAPLTAIPVPLATGYSDTDTLRVFTLKHPLEPVYILVADPLDHRDRAMLEATLWQLLPLLGLLPLLAWLIQRAARQALRSVGQVARQIGQRGDNDLTPIGDADLPLEMQAITTSTNHLLARLSEALQTERALAANAAHELRTPLATARLRLQGILGHPLPEDTAQQVREALDALTQLSRRAEKLLQLSRAESGAALAQTPVQLGQVAGVVAQEFWARAELLDRLQLHIPADHDVVVLGDFDAIAIAVRNLVENAVRYAPQGPIELTVSAPGTVTVRDHGAGLPPAQLAELTRRHVRHSRDAAGFGLGLSIVGTIAERHQARLTLSSPPAGQAQGLEARLDFRPAPATP